MDIKKKALELKTDKQLLFTTVVIMILIGSVGLFVLSSGMIYKHANPKLLNSQVNNEIKNEKPSVGNPQIDDVKLDNFVALEVKSSFSDHNIYMLTVKPNDVKIKTPVYYYFPITKKQDEKWDIGYDKSSVNTDGKAYNSYILKSSDGEIVRITLFNENPVKSLDYNKDYLIRIGDSNIKGVGPYAIYEGGSMLERYNYKYKIPESLKIYCNATFCDFTPVKSNILTEQRVESEVFMLDPVTKSPRLIQALYRDDLVPDDKDNYNDYYYPQYIEYSFDSTFEGGEVENITRYSFDENEEEDEFYRKVSFAGVWDIEALKEFTTIYGEIRGYDELLDLKKLQKEASIGLVKKVGSVAKYTMFTELGHTTGEVVKLSFDLGKDWTVKSIPDEYADDNVLESQIPNALDLEFTNSKTNKKFGFSAIVLFGIEYTTPISFLGTSVGKETGTSMLFEDRIAKKYCNESKVTCNFNGFSYLSIADGWHNLNVVGMGQDSNLYWAIDPTFKEVVSFTGNTKVGFVRHNGADASMNSSNGKKTVYLSFGFDGGNWSKTDLESVLKVVGTLKVE